MFARQCSNGPKWSGGQVSGCNCPEFFFGCGAWRLRGQKMFIRSGGQMGDEGQTLWYPINSNTVAAAAAAKWKNGINMRGHMDWLMERQRLWDVKWLRARMFRIQGGKYPFSVCRELIRMGGINSCLIMALPALVLLSIVEANFLNQWYLTICHQDQITYLHSSAYISKPSCIIHDNDKHHDNHDNYKKCNKLNRDMWSKPIWNCH